MPPYHYLRQPFLALFSIKAYIYESLSFFFILQSEGEPLDHQIDSSLAELWAAFMPVSDLFQVISEASDLSFKKSKNKCT